MENLTNRRTSNDDWLEPPAANADVNDKPSVWQLKKIADGWFAFEPCVSPPPAKDDEISW